MSTAREPCPNCQLPFYTDRNDECPYCATADGGHGEADEATGSGPVDTTPAGSVRRGAPPSRPRTTCSQCGLDYYADGDGGCPYCDAADSRRSSGAAASEEAPAAAESEPAQSTASGRTDDPSARSGGDSGGLLSWLRSLFGR